MAKPFRFKHFTIQQSNASLKVGTDAMLLGALVESNPVDSILDIGTGTGVIALMLAQRISCKQLIALEPDEASFIDAKINFDQQTFNSNYHLFPTSIQAFSTQERFDLIVSNPPFYEGTFLSEFNAKNSSKHQINLTFYELLSCSSSLLTPTGNAWYIFPFEVTTTFIELAQQFNLFPHKIITLYGKPNSPKRTVVAFSKSVEQEVDKKSLIIRDNNGFYTEEYIELTKEYHAVDLRIKRK